MTDVSNLFSQKIRGRRRLGIVLLGLLILGILFTRWTVRRENRQIREELLQQSRLLAQSLHLDRIQALSGTPADESRQEYHRLKGQLRSAVQINPAWRWIYLIGRHADGTVFFLMDSEAEDSPDLSPPGQLYPEAPAALQRVFDAQVSATTGPIRDRWGTWLSAWVPLADPKTGELAAVLGIDIAASAWHRQLVRAARVPVLSTLALLVVATAGYLLRGWRTSENHRIQHRWRRVEKGAAIAAGLILTLTAVWLVHAVEERQRKEAFSTLAYLKTDRILEAFRSLRNAEIEGVAHFIEGSDVVTREEFRSYAKYLVRVPEVLAWGWVPAVKAAEKDAFEQGMRESGHKSYQIWEINADGKRVGSSGRDIYYPLHFVESFVPLSKYGITSGRDLGAIEPVRSALEAAMQTRLVTATDLLPSLPGASARRQQLMIIRPIFGQGASGTVKGFALAMVDPALFLQAFRGEDHLGNRLVSLDLLQLRTGEPPERLASTAGLEDPSAGAGPLTGSWIMTRPVLAFGKTFALAVRPTAEFIAQHANPVGWLVLLVGLSLTVAGTLAVHFLLHRHEDLEELVGARTFALATSMRRFNELAFHSRSIAWEHDANGLYTNISGVAQEVLGYAPKELIGKKHFYDLHPPAEREAFKARVFQIMAGRKSVLDLVSSMVSKSGEIVWVSTHAVPILNPDGTLRGYQGMDVDITARQRAEDDLARLSRDNQQVASRYRALIRASDTGAWEYHDDTAYMWTSPEYFEMLGRDPADFPQEPGKSNVDAIWLDLLHPDDRERARQEFTDYMHNPEGMYQHTFRMSHADGHWVWILSRGQLLRDAEGHPTPVLVGTHIDITESKRAEQYREMNTRAVQILSQPGEFNQRLDELTALLQAQAELDAVSIRLREGIRFPFAAQRGFSADHQAECLDVVALDPQGNPRKDAGGNLVFQCHCGLALSAAADRASARFSPGGSCWTNDLKHMLRSAPDPCTEPRNTCLRDGYVSIAWIPIRLRGDIIGLLQLHDRRKNRFSPEIVQILESIASHVGEAWQRRRAEQDYHTLFQTMLEGFALHEIICDEHGQPADYRFLALNPAFERMTGLKAAELVGRTAREALSGISPRWIEIYGNVALTGTALSFENHSAAQDRYFEVTVFRPAPNQFACIFNDITERKLAEYSLRENRRRYVALLANLPGMAYRGRNDRARTLDFASWGCKDLTGYDPEDLVRNKTGSFNELIALPYREYVWQEWQKALHEHRTFEGEYQIITRSGEAKWVWERGEAIFNSKGEFVGLEGFISDISARKRAEAEREQLIQAIEQSGDTILITDAEGTILYVNPAFERVTGYTREMAIGRKPNILRSGEHDATFYREMWETLRAGQIWTGEIVNRRKDGVLFTEQATISPVRDFAGHLVSYVAVKRDITQQLHDQSERENLRNELVQAQKMESIGRLAGGVAHDFNNMLQAILGYTEMALEQVKPDQPLHADLLEIQKAAQRSSALTRQLQVFARKQTMAPKVLNLNQSVEGMFAMLRRLIGEDIQLDWNPGPDLGFVKIDPSQLDQIVANLCVNARDAIEKDGHVIIETRNAHIDRFGQDLHGGIEPGAYVLLSVSDNGSGMSAEVLGHLFEPFFTTKPLGKGTGLGLSTVYGIVKQNGGGIQVYSEPGRGSTFKIYLPRHGETAEVAPKDEALDPASPNHETILLVEDEESILKASRRMLESLGYQVLSTNSPNAAIRLAESTGNNALFNEYTDRIDLLITDVIMPEMSGPDLVERLHARYPDLKHLFMSGYTANLIAVQGVQTGKTNFIQKPFSRTALAQKVREILDRK